MINISTEITTGIPNPPFRIIAPSGAPIKKKNTHANESVIFLCQSDLCERMLLSLSSVTNDFMLQSELKDDILLSVADNVLSLSSELKERNILSVLRKAILSATIFAESVLVKVSGL